MGRGFRSAALAALAIHTPVALYPQAALLRRLSPRGAPDALRAGFTAKGRAELTRPADRRLAAQAIGEIRFPMQRMPRPHDSAKHALGRLNAVPVQSINMPCLGIAADLYIFALEHLFDFIPTEPTYGPRGRRRLLSGQERLRPLRQRQGKPASRCRKRRPDAH